MSISTPTPDIAARAGTVAWHDVAPLGAAHVLDAEGTLTLADLLRLGPRLAPRLLPGLAGRAVALVRASAARGPVDAPQLAGRPPVIVRAGPGEWLGLRRVPGRPAAPAALAIDDDEALLCAWRGLALELRTAHTRLNAELPDRLVFDLDPGPRTAWPQMLQVAALLHASLQTMGLKSLLKTSGARGLHLVVPVAPRWPAEAMVGVAEATVAHWQRRFPDRLAPRANDAAGRVFIDPRRNARGATLVAAYSLRVGPGCGVSMPVRWNELCELSGGDHWTLASLPRRLEELGDVDPWAGEERLPQSLDTLVQAMGLPLPPR